MKNVTNLWLLKAERAYAEANLLVVADRTDYSGAASRACFATIYAARAAVEEFRHSTEPNLPRGNAALINEFSSFKDRRGDLGQQVAVLTQATRLQESVDFDLPIVTRLDAEKAIDQAQGFIEAVAEHLGLQKNKILKPY